MIQVTTCMSFFRVKKHMQEHLKKKKTLYMYDAIFGKCYVIGLWLVLKSEHSSFYLWQEYLSNSGSVEGNILQVQAIGESAVLQFLQKF